LERRIFRLSFAFSFLLIVFSSCSVKKFIPKGDYLVGKYRLQFEGKNQNPQLSLSDVRRYVQPKPNKKLIFTRLNVWAFYKKKQNPTKFNAFLEKKIGQAPVYFHPEDAEMSIKSIKRYLDDIGFFNASVRYEVAKKNKVADVSFFITTNKPYRYDTIFYTYGDTTLARFIKNKKSLRLLHKGDIFNVNNLDDQRNAIAEMLRNQGYYYFNRNYVQFVVDTNQRKHTVAVNVVLRAKTKPDLDHPGKTISIPHTRYIVKSVRIFPNFQGANPTTYDTVNHQISFKGDTSRYQYKIILTPARRFALNAFDNAIKIKPNRYFSDESVQKTYNNLFNYRVLRTVNIGFDTTGAGRNDSLNVGYLNARILMQTGKLNTISVETVGTNSSGNLGVTGAVSYSNRNIFHGGEVLSLSLNGGFEAEKQVPLSGNTSGNFALFNTFETGINASLYFPMALFPFHSIPLTGNSRTSINLGYTYQLRPYYSLKITNTDLGYSWDQNQNIKHILTPINLNFVKVNPTPEFDSILRQETNLSLKEQYSSHMIVGLKYSFIYNNQQQNQVGSFNYFRLDFESSGNLLNLFNQVIGSKRDASGSYNIFGVNYSQYARINADYRHYFQFNKKGNVFVLRGLVGLAIPYGNSSEIPYEKGFYAGGANDMRGWHFRMLGPGGFSGSDVYERIGDIQLEANAEYRFPIYNFFKGALFMDAGNIWNYNASPAYPNGQFQWNTFIRQVAIDAGFGLRFDFTYFIFRFDVAAPLRDPSYPLSQRWRVGQMNWHDFVGNFGIGYPF
jgi:outer membrane protein assembly factor BamA